MRKIILIFIPIALIAAGVIYELRKKPAAGFGAFRNCNILLVTIDTLRADHLPAYGYTRIRTPHLDKLADQSLIFEDAISQVPMTLPAHVSLLTGLLPMTHGVRDNSGFILDSKARTLTEILKDNGYQTAAFVSAFVLDSQFGIDQGFDLYSDSFTLAQGQVSNTDVHRIAEETQIEVNAWLQQNYRQKFFLWVHYYDPHDPYRPPEPFLTEYKSSPYDGEIAYTDHVFGDLMAKLDQLELPDNTIVVVTGDHGEGLGEHKEQTHSLFIYNATQHVPLMIRLPNGEGRRIPGIVSHIDVAPTILEWIGIHPDATMQGKSLIPLILEKEKTSRIAYSESISAEVHYGWSPLMGITTADYKYIGAPAPELYDRRTDNKETLNLMRQEPEIGNQLQKQLQTFLHLTSRPSMAKQQLPDLETEEKLRALGYVGTTASGTPESRKIDPKDRIELLERMTTAHRAMDKKDYRAVIELTRGILEQDPNIVEAHFLLASAHLHLRQKQPALDEMIQTVRLKPDHTQTLYNLGFFYQLEGNPKESEYWYLQLLKYEPGHFRGMMNLIQLYRSTNQSEKAQEYLSALVDSYNQAVQTTAGSETKSGLLQKLGEVYLMIGELQLAEQATQKALSLTPNNGMVFFNLGRIYRQSNKLQDSIRSFEQAVKLNPRFALASYHLAESCLASNKTLEQTLRTVEQANSGLPDDERKRLLEDIRHRLDTKE
ncbi:MAG TPA: sulfatase-like hydrolase/transferase [Acidobacteriota bacterium]|nr:sulfatase-like hydrolase/transferase [Acidobacteriota bacterium]